MEQAGEVHLITWRNNEFVGRLTRTAMSRTQSAGKT